MGLFGALGDYWSTHVTESVTKELGIQMTVEVIAIPTDASVVHL
jgi:hypothetical protein